jgi:23S rRNA (guanosine2251-2'-O)-methyltransferase
VDREKKHFFLFGVHPVMEKLKGSPNDIIEILIARGHERGALRLLEGAAKIGGLPIRYVESQELDRLAAGKRHQGVVAKVTFFAYSRFDDLLEYSSHSGARDWILVLDGVKDPGNFGNLLRTAEGMGVLDVVIPKNRSVGVTPTVAKISAGAIHYLKVYRVTNLKRAITKLKERGYWIVGLDSEAKERAYDKVYPEKLVVVLGSEESGIRPSVREECDFIVGIPMRGRIASLNVGVTGGMFLYELLRQRSFLADPAGVK